MGSLFKAREFWSAKLEDEHGFDSHSLVICNIDNSASGEDKIVVGGYSGLLRVFLVEGRHESSANDLLLEIDLGLPIIQLASGRFLSASQSNYLLVLHNRKVSIYSVSGVAGLSNTGSNFNILLMYEHLLERCAFSVIVGPFGQVKGRDFICLQSVDGSLSFYEQETFTFSRPLPNFLLPGPIVYISNVDSFVIASSKNVVSYRYQILALTNGKTTPDWSFILGEDAIDIQVVKQDKKNSNLIIILGERNLFVLSEKGTKIYSKKFDFVPISMICYVYDDRIFTLVSTEFSTLLIYSSKSLKWASQLPFTPLIIKRATLAGHQGLLVALSDSGDLSCFYLGTNPSMSIFTVGQELQIVNYEESEKELEELRRIIKTCGDDSGPNNIVKSSKVFPLIPVTVDITIDDSQNESTFLSAAFSSSETVKNVRVMFDVSSPLTVSRPVVEFPKLVVDVSEVVHLTISNTEGTLPQNLDILLTIVCASTSNGPIIYTTSKLLPIRLAGKVYSTSSSTKLSHRLTFDAVANQLKLSDVFPVDASHQDFGIQLKDSSIVLVTMTSKSMQRKFRISSNTIHGMTFVGVYLISSLQNLPNVKFDPASVDKSNLHIKEVIDMTSQYNELRMKLKTLLESLERWTKQLMAIEKRFLMRMKDRNPTSLNDLDFLLSHVHSRVLQVSENITKLEKEIQDVDSALRSSIKLLIQLICIGSGLKQDQLNLIRSSLGSSQSSKEWLDEMQASLSDLLGKTSSISLLSTQTFKDLLVHLVDQAFRGETFATKSTRTSGAERRTSIINPRTEVIPEEDEENEDN